MNKRFAWHTHSVPNAEISADLMYEFEDQGESTKVNLTAVVSIPSASSGLGGSSCATWIRDSKDNGPQAWNVCAASPRKPPLESI